MAILSVLLNPIFLNVSGRRSISRTDNPNVASFWSTRNALAFFWRPVASISSLSFILSFHPIWPDILTFTIP
jgi:hypothetical protein